MSREAWGVLLAASAAAVTLGPALGIAHVTAASGAEPTVWATPSPGPSGAYPTLTLAPRAVLRGSSANTVRMNLATTEYANSAVLILGEQVLDADVPLEGDEQPPYGAHAEVSVEIPDTAPCGRTVVAAEFHHTWESDLTSLAPDAAATTGHRTRVLTGPVDTPATPATEAGRQLPELSGEEPPRARQSSNDEAVGVAVADLLVLCPSVTVTPEVVQNRAAVSEVVFNASGFIPGGQVELRLTGRKDEPADVGDDGTVSITVPTGDLDCADVTGTVVDTSPPEIRKELGVPDDLTIEATTQVTVLCSEPTGSTGPTGTTGPTTSVDPVVVPPTVVVSPVVVAEGRLTTAVGAGFAPRSAVRLVWLMDDGTSVPAGSVQADRAGSFTTQVLVLLASQVGPRDLLASVAGEGETPGAAALVPVLVVDGTTQPGRRGWVNRR